MNKIALLMNQHANASVKAICRPKIAIRVTTNIGPSPLPKSSQSVKAEKTVPRSFELLTFMRVALMFGPANALIPPQIARKNANIDGEPDAAVIMDFELLIIMMK